MTLKHIDYLFKRNPYRLNLCLRKPSDWFGEEIRNLKREYGNQIQNPGRPLYARRCNGSDGLTNIIQPGKFYMFAHDPLLKCILPYYDILPLVLVFEAGEGCVSGIELSPSSLSSKDSTARPPDEACNDKDPNHRQSHLKRAYEDIV